eukprot:554253_1
MSKGSRTKSFFRFISRISRLKHLKWICLCLFCSWCFLMLITFITLLYVSYPYTNLERLSPITLTETRAPQRPNNIGVYSNVNYQAKHDTQPSQSLFKSSDPQQDIDASVAYQLLARILQPKNPQLFDLDIDYILTKFKFTIKSPPIVCNDVTLSTRTVHGCYSIAIKANLITIDGTDVLSIISGLNYYITNYWLLSLSWTGNNMEYIYDEYYDFITNTIEHPAPQNSVIYGYREYKHTYYKNPCTDSYSMAFWRWEQWEPHIDWMAMNNINLLLLPSLNELIEYVLYTKHFKLTHDDIKEYFVGPAFFAWFRMGNLKGWPPRFNQKEKRVLSLSKFWFDEQLALTKMIMKRCNELGIEIVLSAFSGNVPDKMRELYTENQFYYGSIWYRFGEDNTQLTFLECTDPLYIEIGKQYQRIQYNILKSIDFFGTNTNTIHKQKRMYLWLDQFNELIPSRFDYAYLQSCGKSHFESLQLYEYVADPYIDITWVVQGWMFVNERRFWSNERIYSYLSSVKSDDILILDLIAEKSSIALESNEFFEHDYIWCFLHNFGGNYYLGGNLPHLLDVLEQTGAYHEERPYLKGIGISMEGITNNEILYNAVLRHSYVNVVGDGGVPLGLFLQQYVASRYGVFIFDFNENGILDIYQELVQIVYQSHEKKWSVSRSLIAMRPGLRMMQYNGSDLVLKIENDPSQSKKKSNKFVRKRKRQADGDVLKYKFELNGEPDAINSRWRISQFQSNYIDYNFCKIFENWRRWIMFANEFKKNKQLKYIFYSPTFANDIAEVTRQVLSDLFLQLYNIWRNVLFANDASRESEAMVARQHMLEIIDDMNDLLSYFEHFRLDVWVEGARSYGENENDMDYMEMNARNLVTRWGPNAEISEYASREWNGLLNNYYKPRWQMFFDGHGFAEEEIEEFEVSFQYETIDDLDLDQNHLEIENGNFAPFYKTLSKIYRKYIKLIDCKQETLVVANDP